MKEAEGVINIGLWWSLKCILNRCKKVPGRIIMDSRHTCFSQMVVHIMDTIKVLWKTHNTLVTEFPIKIRVCKWNFQLSRTRKSHQSLQAPKISALHIETASTWTSRWSSVTQIRESFMKIAIIWIKLREWKVLRQNLMWINKKLCPLKKLLISRKRLLVIPTIYPTCSIVISLLRKWSWEMLDFTLLPIIRTIRTPWTSYSSVRTPSTEICRRHKLKISRWVAKSTISCYKKEESTCLYWNRRRTMEINKAMFQLWCSRSS